MKSAEYTNALDAIRQTTSVDELDEVYEKHLGRNGILKRRKEAAIAEFNTVHDAFHDQLLKFYAKSGADS